MIEGDGPFFPFSFCGHGESNYPTVVTFMKLQYLLTRTGIPFAAKFFTGNFRSVRTKKNIVAMLALKGITIVIGFLMVPLTLRYLNPTNFGIWLTLSSIIGWFAFFDIGLGNGLRNKFAEAVAKKDMELARTYLSTTYAFLLIIVSIIFALFLVISPFLDWSHILNTPAAMSGDLSNVVLATFAFFCLRFFLGIIGTVLIADHKPAVSSLLEVLTGIISLALIWMLLVTTSGSLFYLSLAVGFSTTIVPLAASIILYSRTYKSIRPAFSFINTKYARELVQLGLRFFILQIIGIIIFSSSNIIITQLYTPADVVPYNIAFKYYNIVLMVFTIVLTPFWSAYTEAYAQGDIQWVKKTIAVLKRGWLIAAAAVIVMSLFADHFYRYWVGRQIQIPIGISLSMGMYVLIVAWSNIYANFINGIGKIQLQIISAVIIGVVNIPLAVFLATKLHLGIPGVILAPCVCLLPGCFLWPIQVRKILSGTAAGIWAR